MVGLAVGTLLVGGILVLIEQSQKGYMHSSEVTDLQQNLRVAMDRMVRIIQTAGVNPRQPRGAGDLEQRPGLHGVPRGGHELHPPLRRPDGDGDVQDADDTGQAVVTGVVEGMQTVALRTDSIPFYFQPETPLSVQVPGSTEVRVPLTLPIGSNNPNVYMGWATASPPATARATAWAT